jgi:hypothetical protein
MSKAKYSVSDAQKQLPESGSWEEARRALSQFRTANDLDEFAAQHFERFKKFPPDLFDPPDSSVWREVRKATAPNGFITRLEEKVPELYFVTLLPKHLHLRPEEYRAENFFNWVHLKYLRERLKGRRLGPMYYRIELGENGVIHPHLIVGKKALGWSGHKEKVYDLEGLVRYLKKPLLPWSAENLALYLKAKRIYFRYLPRHSGTIDVGYRRLLN